MHPYNFEPIFFFLSGQNFFGQIIVRNPKTTDSKTLQHKYLTCWMILEQKRTMPCADNFWDINCAHPKINTPTSVGEGEDTCPNTCDE